MRLLYLWSLHLYFLPVIGSGYITDLSAFSSLAGCAASAVSYAVQSLTSSFCPAAVSALQSCACSQDQNSGAVSITISSRVLNTCGSTATEDVASAAAVFSTYCNQVTAGHITVAPKNTVSQYITDLDAFSQLGPCAGSALSYVIQSFTSSLCPNVASALNSCACTKNQNSLAASESINTRVLNSCGSTHSEDVTSAQAIFGGYCNLTSTSIFPSPSLLSGAVTYYITDLPTYSSLALCAQSAIYYPMYSLASGLYADCPSDPMELVSCACVKDGNSQDISSSIFTRVKNSCGTTASAQITSALGVFDYYCSAGKGLIIPAGVTASVTTTARTTGATTGATAGGTASKTVSKTGTFTSSTADATISVLGSPLVNTNAGVPVAAIAGGVGGGVVFILFILIVGYTLRRQRAQKERAVEPDDNNVPFKAELPSDAVMAKPRNIVLRKPLPNVAFLPVERDQEETVDQKRVRLTAELHAIEQAQAQKAAEMGGPEVQELGGRSALPNEVPGPGSSQFPSELGG